MIRRRVAQQLPIDSWQEDGLHFFVFQLAPAEDGLAVFLMHPDSTKPISAVQVAPLPGGEASVTDLLDPERSYVAPVR